MTQFSFAPARVVRYCCELERRIPAIPVYVGLAGPTEVNALLKLAQLCGVSAPLRALQAQGMGANPAVHSHTPARAAAAAVHYGLGRESSNLVGAHFYSFGEAAETVAWMNREIISGDERPELSLG